MPGKPGTYDCTYLGEAPVPGKPDTYDCTYLGEASVPGKPDTYDCTHLGKAPVPGKPDTYDRGLSLLQPLGGGFARGLLRLQWQVAGLHERLRYLRQLGAGHQ